VLEIATDQGMDLRIVRSVIEVNEARVPRMLDKIRAMLDGELRGKTLALLGLTFKPNTDDLRESPAVAVLDGLIEGGATVRAYDPTAHESLASTPRRGLVLCEDEYDAARDADGLVLATEWNQFRSLDLDRLKETLKEPVVVDLRNVYEPDTMKAKGFRYDSVGR
jgi:UDPglucose 6-dehydrogenase